MKTKLIILTLLIMAVYPLYGQLLHPWWVTDGGGGKSQGGTFLLNASVGQAAAMRMTHIDTGKVLESGFIPGIRSQAGYLMTAEILPQAAWNLISPPVKRSDMRPASFYPGASSVAYAFTGNYVVEDTLEAGNAYWIQFPTPPPSAYVLQGTAVLRETVFVFPGWTMLGSLSYPILASTVTPISPVTFTTVFYGFNGSYRVEDTLKPGHGYWVKTSNMGLVVLANSSSMLEPSIKTIVEYDDNESGPLSSKSQFSSLMFEDKDGNKQSVQFSSTLYKGDLNRFELPPLPPEGLDVRFVSGRFAEAPITDKEGKQIFPLKISGGKFPILLKWEKPLAENGWIEILYQGEKPKQYSLSNCGDIKIVEDNFVSAKIVIQRSVTQEIPREFALFQNYPNPFNPSTKIRYDVPKTSRVVLKVFNLIGQEVMTLIDGIEEPGFKSVELDASNLASGIYFYKFQTDEVTLTKKFILIR
ncbi:MAG: T9SS type A sorting domain-containing protein [Ignavibacteriales bacterium]|nr:T9SS type A sorting domain-containing protein [Ignavibacteriales bacterium]